jgi:hypothetical protein
MAKREIAEGMKRCAGAPGLGYPAHDAPIADFGPNRSSKDGLYHQCREHAKVYQAHWRAKHADEVAAKAEAAGEPAKPKRQPKPAQENPMPADELEEALAAFGGPDTEEGQALLKAEADKAKAARKRTKKAAAEDEAKAAAAEANAEANAEAAVA